VNGISKRSESAPSVVTGFCLLPAFRLSVMVPWFKERTRDLCTLIAGPDCVLSLPQPKHFHMLLC